MSFFELSAFADEYSPDIDRQIEGLLINGIGNIEIRGVNGKNVSELDRNAAESLAVKLSDAGIGISAIGSPAGKVNILDADAHRNIFDNILYTARILGAKRIRGFSYYCDPSSDRDKVLKALEPLVSSSFKAGILYCHENEKGIYGDTVERCLDIIDAFGDDIGCVFDPANFIQCGVDARQAFDTLYRFITYMHIKDVSADGTIVAAGEGVSDIPQMLKRFAADKKHVTLTLEPHLKVFSGLSELENGENTKIQTVFKTNEAAFEYAAAKLKNIIRTI